MQLIRQQSQHSYKNYQDHVLKIDQESNEWIFKKFYDKSLLECYKDCMY